MIVGIMIAIIVIIIVVLWITKPWCTAETPSSSIPDIPPMTFGHDTRKTVTKPDHHYIQQQQQIHQKQMAAMPNETYTTPTIVSQGKPVTVYPETAVDPANVPANLTDGKMDKLVATVGGPNNVAAIVDLGTPTNMSHMIVFADPKSLAVGFDVIVDNKAVRRVEGPAAEAARIVVPLKMMGSKVGISTFGVLALRQLEVYGR